MGLSGGGGNPPPDGPDKDSRFFGISVRRIYFPQRKKHRQTLQKMCWLCDRLAPKCHHSRAVKAVEDLFENLCLEPRPAKTFRPPDIPQTLAAEIPIIPVVAAESKPQRAAKCVSTPLHRLEVSPDQVRSIPPLFIPPQSSMSFHGHAEH